MKYFICYMHQKNGMTGVASTVLTKEGGINGEDDIKLIRSALMEQNNYDEVVLLNFIKL